jgi:signal transduction histidine kinase
MIFRSLRFKLTLWYVFILAVLLVSFSTLLYFTLEKSLFRDVDNKLQSLAALIASESASPLSRFGFSDLDQALEQSLNLKPIGKFIQVLDESGRIGRKSENLRNVQLPISLTALQNAAKGKATFETIRSVGNTPLRIVTLPVRENQQVVRIIQVASSLEDVEDALNTLFVILLVTVPSALIVASLGGQFLANKALKPVDRVTQAARLITYQNLNQRIEPPRVKDEIGRLIETFNDMISRLDKSFHQAKQFSADASHELKTPLTILKGEVEVALRKDRTPQEYREVLRSNLEEINRMSHIVNDLLLLSKADSGDVALTKEEVNLNEVIEDIVSQLRTLARSKEIRIETENHAVDTWILGDALRIRELFLNLIDNAIKYTERGGEVRVRVEREVRCSPLEASEPGEGCEGPAEIPTSHNRALAKVTVSDTGIGISEEDQDRIFDRFYRVDKARSREQGGSGLGLSICKWIVEAHQGEITVESELGRGSSFIVRLPLFVPTNPEEIPKEKHDEEMASYAAR